MKLLDVLAKLGVLRYGATAATYRTAAERPIEMQASDVMNAERDLTTREDVKKAIGRKPAPTPPTR